MHYRVLTEGAVKTPAKSDTVTVHYRGAFLNGAEFDSSISRPLRLLPLDRRKRRLGVLTPICCSEDVSQGRLI